MKKQIKEQSMFDSVDCQHGEPNVSKRKLQLWFCCSCCRCHETRLRQQRRGVLTSRVAFLMLFSLAFPQACYEEIIFLEPEVKSVAEDGNDLIRRESLVGNFKDDVEKDIRDFKDRYEELKNRSDEEVKRWEVSWGSFFLDFWIGYDLHFRLKVA